MIEARDPSRAQLRTIMEAAMKTGLTLTEVDERIAAIRENLEQLVEQSTADSSAGNDDLNATRIAEQEQELAELTELRETLLRR
jgi:predicted mannosyl-3-phosphoglycerate phosphatase (HAD superfamily)